MQITMSGVLNVSQMVATCAAVFLLDRVGRKPPLLFGSTMNAISHFIVAAMIGKFSYNWDLHPKEAWVGVAFILVFMFCFGLGWSPVPWALREFKSTRVSLTSSCRGSVVQPSCQGCGHYDVRQLVLQLHHWTHYSPDGPRHRVRHVHLLRSLLGSVRHLDMVPLP